jgi:hypothetical protein
VMKWPQFSLRSLLLATTAVAAGFYAAGAVPPIAWLLLAIAITYVAASAAVGFLLATAIVGGGRLMRWLFKSRRT